MGAPVMIGAGLGALGSAITGGNPIKGAVLGGAGGGLFGGSSSLLGGGSLLGSSTVPASSVGKAVLANSIDDMGMAALGGTYYNPAYYQNVLGTPVFTGGQGVFSNALDMAKNSLPEMLTSNITPNNLMVANSLLSNLDNQNQMGASPISVAVRQGTAPQQYSFNTGTAIRRA